MIFQNKLYKWNYGKTWCLHLDSVINSVVSDAEKAVVVDLVVIDAVAVDLVGVDVDPIVGGFNVAGDFKIVGVDVDLIVGGFIVVGDIKIVGVDGYTVLFFEQPTSK